MNSLALARIGGVLAFVSPLLAGLGGAGGWAIGLFALIFVARLWLVTDPEQWATPQRLALAAAVNAIVAALMWGAGKAMASLAGIYPHWGALPPLLLGIAGTAFSVAMIRQYKNATPVPPVVEAPKLNRAERRRKASRK